MAKNSSWGVRLLLLSGSVLVCLLLAEIGLRLLWTPEWLLSDPVNGKHPDYAVAPFAGVQGRRIKSEYTHTFEHTVQRMRGDRLVEAEKDPKKRARILFLGDSFTYGLGANNDETFPSRLAARWPDVEIINSGCSGYGQVEELAVLDRLGGATKPDLAVIMFFWNDLGDNLRTNTVHYEFAANGQVRRVRPATAPEDPLKLWPLETNWKRSPWRTLYFFELCREGMDAIRYHWLGRRPRRIRDEAQQEMAWKLTEPLFAMLKRRADELGTRLVCVCIPDYNQVNPQAVVRNIDPVDFQVQERLERLCQTNGIPYFDPLPRLSTEFVRRDPTRLPLYYPVDRHMTPVGYELMADYLGEVLEPLLPAATRNSEVSGGIR